MIKKCEKCQSTNFRIAISDYIVWINCSHCNDEKELSPCDDMWKLIEVKE